MKNEFYTEIRRLSRNCRGSEVVDFKMYKEDPDWCSTYEKDETYSK